MNALHISSCTLLLLLLCLDVNCYKTITTGIPNCPIVDCGDGVNITYPFWVSNSSVDYSTGGFCGYIDFMITCKGTRPSMTTNSDNYTVKAINRETHTLSLIDTDVMNVECPRALHNVSFNSTTPLSIPRDGVKYLWFFFNCTSHPILERLENYRVTCLQNVSGDSYVFDGPNPPAEYMYLLRECKDKTVVSPVLPTTVDDGSLPATFGQAMKGGFNLTWTDPVMNDCRSCEKSGGLCGYYNKSGLGSAFQCFCEDGVKYAANCNGAKIHIMRRSSIPVGQKILIVAAGVGAVITILVFLFLVLCVHKYHKKMKNTTTSTSKKMKNTCRSTNQTVEAFLLTNGPLAIKCFKYSELKKMTAHFSSKIGQGAYGSVYKGQLPDGTAVAVKVLTDAKGNGEEFINEVASIGRTNHINVVTLLGFCSEGSQRALIYEFMPNGSLEKFLFVDHPKTTTQLGWEQLHTIALGIAKGLEYIHRGCNTRMVHFDIKPHNILLDENFCPKISDFGLAKLYTRQESILSTVYARGTIGYIAPEVFSRNFGVVSSKSDVYSYGMMLLEMVGGRRNVKNEVSNSSELYFPHWIYEHFDQEIALQACGVTAGCEDLARKMILVGLWCIQTNPNSRPSISKVREMLEGNVASLEIPPKPYICSPEKSEHTTIVDSFATSTVSSYIV